MAHNKSFISEVLGRKIPQIIGMYIASVWLAVEISDWMSGRFDLSEQFSTYVFVGMMVLLPAVILVAWGHGRSGTDQWSLLEKLFLPINIVAAVVAVMYLVKPIEHIETPALNQIASINSSKSAMKKMAVVDAQTGKKVTYEVAKQAYHQNVINFFWDNKTGEKDLDWMSYGNSWLLSQDLKRTPVITSITAYNLFNKLVGKGFKGALNIPLALARKVADNRSSKWMIMGSFFKKNGSLSLTANLYNVKSGEMVKSVTTKDDNWLIALDDISNKIGEFILNTTEISKNIIPQLAITEHTSNNVEAIKYLIQAKNSVTFNNDFKSAVDLLDKAVKVDPSFAEAYVLSMRYYNNLGDFPRAIKQAEKALELDYKLYQESVFLVKARLFGMQSENQEKVIKVLENWVKIYPSSVQALSILGGTYIIKGNHQEQAKAIFKKLYELEGPGHDALINLGKIYRLQNNKEKAIEYIKKYLDANPTKVDAYLELANTYKQFGLFDKAREMFEEASLYDNSDFKAEIGLANIVASKGNYSLAIEQLQKILQKSKNDKQKLTILGTISEIYLLTGQIKKCIKLADQSIEPGKKILPPIAYTFQIKGANAIYLTLLGEFKKAHEVVIEMTKELTAPFDKLASSFSKEIYEAQHDVENYKIGLSILEDFMKNLNMLTLEPNILSSKAQLAYWENDFQKALELYNKAIEITTQSFVTLLTLRQVDEIVYKKSETLLALSKYDEVIENLNIIIARTPLYGKVYYLKAKAYHLKGDIENRDLTLKIAHKIWKNADPEYLDYQKLLAFEKSILNK